MNLEQQTSAILARLQKAVEDLPKKIGNEAVNFFLDNFKKQGFQGDSGTELWPARKNPNAWGKPDDSGRALLVKTGRLRRSIRIGQTSADRVSIIAGGQEAPYARAHNEGYRGAIKQTVNPFTRKMPSSVKVKGFIRNGRYGKELVKDHTRTYKGSYQVKSFTRTINQNLPQRKFIGRSKQLDAIVHDTVKDELRIALGR